MLSSYTFSGLALFLLSDNTIITCSKCGHEPAYLNERIPVIVQKLAKGKSTSYDAPLKSRSASRWIFAVMPFFEKLSETDRHVAGLLFSQVECSDQNSSLFVPIEKESPTQNWTFDEHSMFPSCLRGFWTCLYYY